MPCAISRASPSARFLSTSMRTISENRPLCINANAEDEPTKPQPTIATFFSLTIRNSHLSPQTSRPGTTRAARRNPNTSNRDFDYAPIRSQISTAYRNYLQIRKITARNRFRAIDEPKQLSNTGPPREWPRQPKRSGRAARPAPCARAPRPKDQSSRPASPQRRPSP